MAPPESSPYRPIDLRGAGLALLVSLFWGANPVALKVGLADAPPLRLAALRFSLGGGVILLWAWATGRLRAVRIAPAERRPLLVLGLLLTVQVGLMNVATTMTSAAHVAIILNLYAVHTVVLSHFLVPGDRLTLRRLAGVLVAYSGILVLFGGQVGRDRASLAGDAIMFVSALLLAERTVYMARAVQRLDPVKLLLAQSAVGAGLFTALSLALEPTAVRWTPSLGAALAFQGVVVAGFNFIVNLWLLKRHRPSALSPFFLTQPLFGVLVAAVVTGDPLTVQLLLATLAVVAGIALTHR